MRLVRGCGYGPHRPVNHGHNTKVKRFDKPKVKCATGSYTVKLPLKDVSLTPLSSSDRLKIAAQKVRDKMDAIIYRKYGTKMDEYARRTKIGNNGC